MDNEKYGIELELITNKFKQKMQEVKNAFKGVENKKINVNTNNSQIEYVKSQIKEIQYLLKQADKGFEVGDTLKLEAKLEKLNNQYNKLISNQNKLSVSSSKATTGLSKGLDKMTSKIKRFGLSLLSIRSIWSLVSRASSAYLSQDTELANKLQSAWVGLGAILAPIINFITTLILKLVSVINGFVKALTGVDLIAKASAKSMKGAAGSANALKKSLAGFDELTNLDSDAGGGTGGMGGILDPFATIDEDWANMMDKIIKGTDTFKTNLTKKMRESVEDAKKILKQSGFSDAFIDMYDLAANGSISVIEGFIDSFKGLLLIVDGILSGDKEKIIEGFKTLGKGIWEILTGLIQWIVGIIGMLVTEVVDLIVKGAKWIYDKVLVPIDNWVDEKIRQPIKKAFKDAIDWVKEQFNGWKSNIHLFVTTIGQWFSDLGNGIKNGAISAWDWIVGQFNGWKANISLFINTIAGWFSNLWKSILRGFITIWNKIANVANKAGGKLGMPTLPVINSYAVGTNYVPEDQLAFIHKGEAVVPKKYNNGGYTPNNNNETNALLEQVITAINNIEINPYTTVRDVGKASLSYINAKSRQLGESVVV